MATAVPFGFGQTIGRSSEARPKHPEREYAHIYVTGYREVTVSTEKFFSFLVETKQQNV